VENPLYEKSTAETTDGKVAATAMAMVETLNRIDMLRCMQEARIALIRSHVLYRPLMRAHLRDRPGCFLHAHPALAYRQNTKVTACS
jgi:hypothetical protein